MDFLELLLDAYSVPLQRIQTDRSGEFMAEEVQNWMKDHSIKYRPNKPGSPHLNGKVERVQRTMLEEFYAATDLKSPDLAGALGEWILYYNYQRTHGSLGTTPIERFCKKIYDAPTWDAVAEQYDPNKERFFVRDYKLDQRLAELKSGPKQVFPALRRKKSSKARRMCQGRRARFAETEGPLTHPSTLLQCPDAAMENLKEALLK